ncbi:MAG: manganese efflux pump MntP family protein [Bacilli bacterium]|nr:manganese efflux pump MntP family protein [Bacilli bacterium]
MIWTPSLFIQASLLGIALAMDAFSVSIANAFNEPHMKKSRAFIIALTFGLFQAIMPLIGWVCVYYLADSFNVFATYIVPCLALLALGFIGGKMIFTFIKNRNSEEEVVTINNSKHSFVIALFIQAIATSIDALSVGLTTSNYNFAQMSVTAAIIFGITFILCIIGLIIGKTIGSHIGKKAELIGGILLVCIGIFIFSKGMINAFAPWMLPPFLK